MEEVQADPLLKGSHAEFFGMLAGMVLTKDELIDVLRNEARILGHLAGKVERDMLDYRPTRTQRSTLELLQYMAIMGPTQMRVIKRGIFDRETLGAEWRPAEEAAARMTFEECVAAIERQGEDYGCQLAAWTDQDFRGVVDLFGQKMTRGRLVVDLVVSGHAAYRTQMFCYLKSCGRDELNTMNLWAGMDGAA
jgi:hypothetical protein